VTHDYQQQAGESEVSNLINSNYDCKLSELSYIVESSPDRLRTRNSIRIFKSVGDLKVNDNVIKWNSGNPDYRKLNLTHDYQVNLTHEYQLNLTYDCQVANSLKSAF
jgi:hypothetical protein